MWAKYRRQRHLSIALAPEIKCQLVRRKALGQGSMGAQITAALLRVWEGQPMPAAVVAHPAPEKTPITSGRYAGMRQQEVIKQPAVPRTDWIW